MSWTRSVSLVLMVVALFALFTLPVEGARPLGRDVDALFKRNAWWSKKSAEYASHPGGLFADVKAETGLEVMVGCYTGECVPDLLFCGNQAQTEERYIQCKLQHRACAIKCLGNTDA